MGQEKGKQITDFEIIEIDGCTPAGQSTPALTGLKKLYKEINCKLSTTPLE